MERDITFRERIFLWAAFAVLLWCGMKFFGWQLLALLFLAVAVSWVDRGARRLSELTGFPKRLCALFLIIIFFIFFCAAAAFLAVGLYRELGALLPSLSEGRGRLLVFIETLLLRAEGLMGGRTALSVYFEEVIPTLVNKAVSFCVGALYEAMAAIVGRGPSVILGGAVVFIATVWLAVDLDRIRGELLSVVPEGIANRLSSWISELIRVASGYLCAYLLIFIMTFSVVYVGFLILDAPFALSLAALSAAVDMLPLFGAGAVLLPLAAAGALLGEYAFSLGTVVLLLAVCILRQIAEPYIVGHRIGLSPFISFVSAFVGLSLFGAVGAILFPLFSALIFNNSKKKDKNAKKYAGYKKM